MDPVSFVGQNVFNAKNNIIEGNFVKGSLDDGIHIQGDETIIRGNVLIKNLGYGIYLCGEGLGGGCFFPGEEAVSENNIVGDNLYIRNRQGKVGDFGVSNVVD